MLEDRIIEISEIPDSGRVVITSSENEILVSRDLFYTNNPAFVGSVRGNSVCGFS